MRHLHGCICPGKKNAFVAQRGQVHHVCFGVYDGGDFRATSRARVHSWPPGVWIMSCPLESLLSVCPPSSAAKHKHKHRHKHAQEQQEDGGCTCGTLLVILNISFISGKEPTTFFAKSQTVLINARVETPAKKKRNNPQIYAHPTLT